MSALGLPRRPWTEGPTSADAAGVFDALGLESLVSDSRQCPNRDCVGVHGNGKGTAWLRTRGRGFECRKCGAKGGNLDAVAYHLVGERYPERNDRGPAAMELRGRVRAWFAENGYCGRDPDYDPFAIRLSPARPRPPAPAPRLATGPAPDGKLVDVPSAWPQLLAAQSAADRAAIEAWAREVRGWPAELATAVAQLPDVVHVDGGRRYPGEAKRLAAHAFAALRPEMAPSGAWERASYPLLIAMRGPDGEPRTVERRPLTRRPAPWPKSSQLPRCYLRGIAEGVELAARFGNIPAAVEAARRGEPVIIAEGGPDFLAAASLCALDGAGAALGAAGASSLPGLARALRAALEAAGVDAPRVVCVPDRDPPRADGSPADGERFMLEAADVLAGVAGVFVAWVPLGPDGTGDLSDVAATGVEALADLFEAAELRHRAPVDVFEVDAAGEAVEAAIWRAIGRAGAGRLPVVKIPAGVGKTRAALRIASDAARDGRAVVYAVRTVGDDPARNPHARPSLADEALALLAPDVSGFIARGAMKACAFRRDVEPVFGRARRRRTCGTDEWDPCEHRETCDGARAARPLPGAVMLVAHAALPELLASMPRGAAEPGADLPLVADLPPLVLVDESPGLVALTEADRLAVETLYEDRAATAPGALRWRHVDECPRHPSKVGMAERCGCSLRPVSALAAALAGVFTGWAEDFGRRVKAAEDRAWAQPFARRLTAADVWERLGESGPALLARLRAALDPGPDADPDADPADHPAAPPLPWPARLRRGEWRRYPSGDAFAAILALWRALEAVAAGEDSATARRVALRLEPDGRRWALEVRAAWAPAADAPIVLLDATPLPAELAAATGREVELHDVAARGGKPAAAVWVQTGAFRTPRLILRSHHGAQRFGFWTGTATTTRTLLLRAVKLVGDRHGPPAATGRRRVIALLTQKALADGLRGEVATSARDRAEHRAEVEALAALRGELARLGYELRVGHYGRDERGSNLYRDADAIVLAGDPRADFGTVEAEAHFLGLDAGAVYEGRRLADAVQGLARVRSIRRAGADAPLLVYAGESAPPEVDGVEWSEEALPLGPLFTFDKAAAMDFLRGLAEEHGALALANVVEALGSQGIKATAARTLLAREGRRRGWQPRDVAGPSGAWVVWAPTQGAAERYADAWLRASSETASETLDREIIELLGERDPDLPPPARDRAAAVPLARPDVASVDVAGEPAPAPDSERDAGRPPPWWTDPAAAWLEALAFGGRDGIDHRPPDLALRVAVNATLGRPGDDPRWARHVAELAREMPEAEAQRWAFIAAAAGARTDSDDEAAAC